MGGAIVSSINIDGLFSFKIPRFDFNAMGTLFVYAITISLIGFMEAISVAKSMAASTKQRLDVNQELIGQGLSNVTSSFFQGYPVSGSFSRSAVNLSCRRSYWFFLCRNGGYCWRNDSLVDPFTLPSSTRYSCGNYSNVSCQFNSFLRLLSTHGKLKSTMDWLAY